MPSNSNGPNMERKEGLSEYSRQLMADTNKILDTVFAPVEAEMGPEEAAFRKLNRRITRTYLIFLLSSIGSEERGALLKQPPDMFTILQRAAERLKEEGERQQFETDLDNARKEKVNSHFKIANNLHLLQSNSPAVVLEKKISEELRRNSEAYEAFCYLTFVDK